MQMRKAINMVILLLTVILLVDGYPKSSAVCLAQDDQINQDVNQIALTIDHTKVGSSLTDFPVLVHLSAASGINKADVSAIFNTLGNSSKKIAVTTADNSTQCYVEIGRWDAATKQAYLWVKVPSISNTADTILYLNYDNNQPDNLTYVGDTGSPAAQQVWTNGFVGVWHLTEMGNKTSGEYKDSTSRHHDGTGAGYGATPYGPGSAPGRVSTGLGYGAYFNGDDAYITIPDSDDFSAPTTGYLTFTWWFNPTVMNYRHSSSSDSYGMDSWININAKGSYPVEYTWTIGNYAPGQYKNMEIAFYCHKPDGGIGDGAGLGVYGANPFKVGDWIYLVGRIDSTERNVNMAAFYQGSWNILQDTFNNYADGMAQHTGAPLTIGTSVNQWHMFEGIMAEIEMSAVWRSDAWLAASNYAGRDNLFNFTISGLAAETGAISIPGTTSEIGEEVTVNIQYTIIGIILIFLIIVVLILILRKDRRQY
jgi:hypothetical protein